MSLFSVLVEVCVHGSDGKMRQIKKSGGDRLETIYQDHAGVTTQRARALLAEVGQYPVSFHWVRQVLPFFNTVLLAPEDLIHHALVDNLELYHKTQDQCRPTRSGAQHNGSQCWIGDVFNILDQLGVGA